MKKFRLLLLLPFFITFFSCNEDDDTLPNNYVQLTDSEKGFLITPLDGDYNGSTISYDDKRVFDLNGITINASVNTRYYHVNAQIVENGKAQNVTVAYSDYLFNDNEFSRNIKIFIGYTGKVNNEYVKRVWLLVTPTQQYFLEDNLTNISINGVFYKDVYVFDMPGQKPYTQVVYKKGEGIISVTNYLGETIVVKN